MLVVRAFWWQEVLAGDREQNCGNDVKDKCEVVYFREDFALMHEGPNHRNKSTSSHMLKTQLVESRLKDQNHGQALCLPTTTEVV